MVTLISVYNSDGLVGRCDARCHDAADPHCDCVCGGVNHGAGERQAVANTRAWAEAWIEAARIRGGDATIRGELGETVRQPALL